jgi:ribosomal protein L13E
MHHFKPMITAQSGKRRLGKGFSPDELKEAGLTIADARKMRIPVDWKRKSSHEDNVASLKSHAEKAQVNAKTKVVTPLKVKKSKN